jgi:hypothetical protein
MSRIERLELVVRSLADRILGEKITFDQIAEQEAAEQGVVYTPPTPQSNVDPDVLPAIEAKLKEIADNYAPFDAAPLHAEIEELKQRVSAADARHIAQERMMQQLVQAADALLQRLQSSEARLDQHRDVINNSVNPDIAKIYSSIKSLVESADDKVRRREVA